MSLPSRITKATFNYARLFARCPPEQLSQLKEFHEKHKNYLKKLEKLPENPPEIDWEYYKENVRPEAVKMVEKFKLEYENFRVPYPEDLYTQKLDEMEKEVKQEIQKFKEESCQRISKFEEEISRLKSLIPFKEMTMDDYRDAYPESAPDFINKPTFWPHTPEEQISVDEKAANDREIITK